MVVEVVLDVGVLGMVVEVVLDGALLMCAAVLPRSVCIYHVLVWFLFYVKLSIYFQCFLHSFGQFYNKISARK